MKYDNDAENSTQLSGILFENNDMSSGIMHQVLAQFWIKSRGKTFVQLGMVTWHLEAGTQWRPSAHHQPPFPVWWKVKKLSMDQISYFPFFTTHFLHEAPRKNRHKLSANPWHTFCNFQEKEDKGVK